MNRRYEPCGLKLLGYAEECESCDGLRHNSCYISKYALIQKIEEIGEFMDRKEKELSGSITENWRENWRI